MNAHEKVFGEKRVPGARTTRGEPMGIEYMIDLPCRPKKELGEEHMLNLVKKFHEGRPQKKSVAAVESAQYIEVPTEGGGSEGSKLGEDLAALDYHISDCLSCLANVACDKVGSGVEAAFGCNLILEYPISTYIEMVVMHAAFAAIEDPTGNPGYKLLRGIIRSHAKGRKTPAHRIRRMGKDYFESRAPKATKVTIEGEKVNLDTDQLMTLLMVGPVPTQATGAFATFITRGIERAQEQGVQDPWVIAPLSQLSEHMRTARKVGRPVKIKF